MVQRHCSMFIALVCAAALRLPIAASAHAEDVATPPPIVPPAAAAPSPAATSPAVPTPPAPTVAAAPPAVPGSLPGTPPPPYEPPKPIEPLVIPPGPGPVTMPDLPKPSVAAPPLVAPAPMTPPALIVPPEPRVEAAPETAPAQPPAPPPEEVVLPNRPVLFITGRTTWDDAEEKMSAAFAALAKAIDKTGSKSAGAPLVQYIETDGEDVGYMAMLPIATPAKGKLPKGVKNGTAPSGKAWKFRHDGSPDDLEAVYARIDEWLSSQHLDMKMVVEEYDEDALSSPEDRIVVDIYVFTR